MRILGRIGLMAIATMIPAAAVADVAATPPPVVGATGRSPLQLPYIYTHWRQFTTENGLPSDHVFAVKVYGNDVWVGTDDGLALIDKQQGKVVKVWKEKDGLPFRAVAGLDVDPKHGRRLDRAVRRRVGTPSAAAASTTGISSTVGW